MKTIQDTLFVNRTREMASLSFELDKEGPGIIFFLFPTLVTNRNTFFLFLYRAKKLTISWILFTKKTLFISLILAKCRTGLIYELRNKSCSPRILCGSVVEHENFFFVLSWWQDEKRRYQRYRLFYLTPCSTLFVRDRK